MGADAGLKLGAFCRKVSKRCREFGECPLGGGQCGFCVSDPRIHTASLLNARLDLVFQGAVFGIQTTQCNIGIGQLALFAFDVGRKLRQPPIEFVDAFFRAFFFAIEQLASIGQALQSCSGTGFVLAQRGQFGSTHRLNASGFGLFADALGLFPDIEVMRFARVGHVGMRLHPTQVIQHRFGLADLGGDFAVADRLTRLLFQAVDLPCELTDDVLDAGEVCLCGLEAQLGFVAPRVQSCNAGSVFENTTALIGPRLNNLTNFALMH